MTLALRMNKMLWRLGLIRTRPGLELSDTERTRNTLRKHPDIDGGWGYVIAVAMFCAAFLSDGPKNCFGILMPILSDDLQSGMTLTSLSGGLFDGTWLAMGPLAAKLIERFGCRPMAFIGALLAGVSFAASTLSTNIYMFIVLYGFSAGVGIGLFYLPTITMINTYLDRKRGLVLGIVTSGSGLGLLCMSFLIELMIEHYGWRGAYLIVGGVYFHLCICASLMRPLDEERFTRRCALTRDEEEDKMLTLNDVAHTDTGIRKVQLFDSSEDMAAFSLKEESNMHELSLFTDKIPESTIPDSFSEMTPRKDPKTASYTTLSLLRDPCLVMFCLTAFLIQLVNNITPMFGPSYAKSIGFDLTQSAKVVSFFGISNTVGRLLSGLLSFIGINNLLIYSVGTTLAGVICFVIPYSTSFDLLLAMAALQGLFIGSFPPLQSVILVEVLGLERLPLSFGIMCFCKSLASLAGPSIVGFLYQRYMDYTVPFQFAGCVIIVANGIHCIMAVHWKQRSSREEAITGVELTMKR